MTADDVIAHFNLTPHPEGGYFRETFRDPAMAGGRARSTAIYFLLKRGQHSHWHRVDAIEIWHFHAGAPLDLDIAPTGGKPATIRLGVDFKEGQQPQGIVPEGWWQRARSTGDWTLVGCTVAPGFEFSGFVLAPPGFDPAANHSR